MKKEITIGDLVKFIMENRRGNAFKAYPEELVASTIKRASEAKTLRYALDRTGNIRGVVVAFYDELTDCMYIHDILTLDRWIMPVFINDLKKLWPTATALAHRRGKLVKYNTAKLHAKITKNLFNN
jgi:hypothetical protein